MGEHVFKTTVVGGENKNVTGIEIPDDVIVGLGAGQRPRLKVTLNGYSYVCAVGKMGGRYMVSLSAAHRQAAGLAAGDAVEIRLAVASEAPQVTVPDDLAAALQAAGLMERFDASAPSRRKEWARQVEDAKAPETRARRVRKVLDALTAKR